MKMLKWFFVFAMLYSLFANHVQAQTRVLAGAQGGQAYSNTHLGVLAGIEIPFAHRFEFDLSDRFSPYESHTALGTGTANIASAGGILWMSKSIGVTGSLNTSEYAVTKLRKSVYSTTGGVVFRKQWSGIPSRLEFDYVRDLPGKMINRVEPSYLQAGRVGLTTRLGCSGAICYRLGWEFEGGIVKNQSNPQCDGTLPGPVTCPRNVSVSGGVQVVFAIEFPRRRQTENEAF
jgi:hypothetical protein